MILSAIRELAYRRLNDQPGDQWSESIMNTYINIAYAKIQKEIRKVDPEAIVVWDYRNTVAGTSWYEKPAATRGLIELGLKTSSADTDWMALKRQPYWVARQNTSIEDVVYCHRGTFVGIFPPPTASVTNGIQYLHAGTDTLAADAQAPKVDDDLAYGIVLWAVLLAKGENPEGDTKEARDLGLLLANIPVDYATPDMGQPIPLSPDVSDARGRGRTFLSQSPGIDQR